jgi:UDP-N-acetylmuramyl tripeptide synthase
MKLSEILSGVRLKRPMAPELAALEIRGLEYDSRRVGEGFLFFAFPGSRADGREFAQAAIERGAAAVASEQGPGERGPGEAGRGPGAGGRGPGERKGGFI